MQIQKGFQCKSCNSFLSHPIDACPVCGDQFYWLIHTEGSLDATQRTAYVGAMLNLMEGAVTEAFLTHGDRLWLPYQFWSKSPNGEVLNEFPWMIDLELFQHTGNDAEDPVGEVVVDDEPEEPNPWDTVPKMALPDFSKMEKEKPKPTVPEPAPAAETLADEPRVIPAPEPRKASVAAVSEPKPRAERPVKEPTQNPLKQLFVPLMIFLFLLFLSLSYLVLRYHKNHMVPVVSGNVWTEVLHERPILS